MAGPRLPKYGPRKGDKRLLPEKERLAFNERVRQLRAEGLGALHIANALGVSPSTLYDRTRETKK